MRPNSNPNPELNPKLDSLLKTLRLVAPRDPQVASRSRNIFLDQAAKMTPGVSFVRHSRLDEWKATFRTFYFTTRKEKSFMFNLVMAVLITVSLILGGGATTVSAAQVAQPGETLYPVKLWSEDLRLGWENNPQQKFDLALQFTARRAEEIQAVLMATGTVPEPVLTRFENQQRLSLQIAANLAPEWVAPALERVRDQAREQQQTMAQSVLPNPAAQQVRARVQVMLQTQSQMAQHGLEDPEWLREQLRLRDRDRISTPTLVVTETETTSITGMNPWTTGTPTPGSGYGPGESQNPWTDETPVPGSGYGPGESQNPWTDETPVPGSGYGPGPGTGDCDNCTPQPNNGGPAEDPAPENGGTDNIPVDPPSQNGNGGSQP